MNPMLDALVAPFAGIDEERALATLGTHWGVTDARLERMDTERDDTFRVRRAGAPDLLLKVAHPDDDPAVVDLQNAALSAVAERYPDLPAPRLVRTRDGARTATVDGRIARVLTWLPGTLMIETERTPAQLHAAGRMLGRLSRALAAVEHPASDRVLAWDLQTLPDLADEAAASAPALSEFVDMFARAVSPALAALPRQLSHNDFHPGNVLVAPADPATVTGVLDFGDVVRTARAADVAVALAYLVPDEGPIAAAWNPFLAGFAECVALEPAELSLLPTLAAARQVQRILVDQALGRAAGETRSAPRLHAKLARIQDEFDVPGSPTARPTPRRAAL